MGWLWGSKEDDGTQTKSSSGSDPLRDLDPSLRSFLEKESPVKYKTAQSPPPPPSTTSPHAEDPAASSTSSSTSQPPTLFPDGRYTHLWKNYKPLSDIEAASKTDQEKLQDVLAGYRERKSQIGTAALTNCALEQWAVNDCIQNGSWTARMTMCHAENRAFERCYTMQSRFLRALGYLSTYDRPPEVDEEIQMHADTLYHRMLAQEKAVEEAKAQGLPIPTFPPLMERPSPEYTSPKPVQPSGKEEGELPLPPALDELKPRVKKQLRARLKGLTPEEREVEEKSIEEEVKAGQILGKHLEQVYKETSENRAKRKAEGRQTFGDVIAGLFGW